MFLGGCAGSTGGGIKAIRIFVLLKAAFRELSVFLLPNAVLRVKVGKKPLAESAVSNIIAFFILYIFDFID